MASLVVAHFLFYCLVALSPDSTLSKALTAINL